LLYIYAIISALFTKTTVFLSNYSSGNVKTNSVRPVSACLTFFEVIWHFFTSDLAFFFHLDLATLTADRLAGTKRRVLLPFWVFVVYIWVFKI